MKEKKTTEVFSMSFLDIMACGFGALVLILLISEFNEVEFTANVVLPDQERWIVFPYEEWWK